MKEANLLTVGTLIALSAAIYPFYPSIAQTTPNCEQAISGIKNDIGNRIGGKVESFNQRVASTPSSPYQGRINELDIYLSNIPGVVRGRNPGTPLQAARNRAITESKGLMLTYAKQAISSCPKIARVSFTQGFHSEGVFILSRDGTVLQAKCYEGLWTENGINPRWEEIGCL